jgi:glycosyltransferase involved in cell wall biosynthesis
LRLGVYADLLYRRDADGISADRAFVKFVTSLPPRVREVVLFGRLDPQPGRHPYALPADVRFVALPHYDHLWALGSVLSSVPRARAMFASELHRLDAVWLFGPHPLALEFARMTRRRGVPLFLGIRQDYPTYVRNRLPNRGWLWIMPGVHALERAFRRIGRDAPTVVAGEELGAAYSRGGARVLVTAFSLVPLSEVVPADVASAKPWNGRLRAITVGRLDPEKNPLLLADVAVRLRRRDARWRLVVVGDGPLRGALAQRIDDLGLSDVLDLRGYVPNGPLLWEEYRESHAFLHVSLTEGLPQVLFEAQAAGLPIVATAVGGVAQQLGTAALLVQPRDPDAIVDALERLAGDPELRHRLVLHGVNAARDATMEVQLDRVAGFFRDSLPPASGASARGARNP